jgi:hypothetical protein
MFHIVSSRLNPSRDAAADLDVLSATWILSCNDENPIITYKGISSRLNLPDTFDVRKLVQSRRELFRPGILRSRLDAWKERMKNGRGIPGWISEIEDKTARDKVIDDLTQDDVFRNQFRTQDGAPKCSIEIMDWGLNHIDRLRKSRADERETRLKRWGTVVIPAVSIFLGFAALFASSWIGWSSISEQTAMKRYEVSFKPKQEAYSRFMSAIGDAAVSAPARDKENVLKQLSQAEQAYFLFEPFLDKETRSDILKRLAKFDSLCVQRLNANFTADSNEEHEFLQQIGNEKAAFEIELYDSLFGEKAIR